MTAKLAPSKHRIGVSTLCRAVLCAVPVLALFGCAALSSTTAATERRPPPVDVVASPEPAIHIRGLCLDPTLSTVRRFSVQVRAALVDRVGAWVPQRFPRDIDGNTTAYPGLDLTVRTVATRAFSSNEGSTHIVIPAVPALAPRPDLTQDGVLEDGGPYVTWKQQAARVNARRKAAQAAAASASRVLSAMPLDPRTASGITACMSALTLTTPPGPDRSFLLASDLMENVPKQMAGSFADAPVLILQPCPGGDAQRCSEAANEFATGLRSRGAGDVTVSRPELADRVINDWLEGAR